MSGLNRQRSAMQMQGRKRGICRENSRGIIHRTTQEFENAGICKGPGLRQGVQSNMPSAEPVVNTKTDVLKPNLAMLKEQEQRMVKALMEIDTQIKALETEWLDTRIKKQESD